MVKWIINIGFLFIVSEALSQNLCAFHDYRKHFLVFDNGKTIELEHLPVQSFQVGGKFVAYVTASGQLKVYFDNESKVLSEQFVSQYIATKSLLVFFIYNQLYVFDHGKTELLSGSVKNYAPGDSLVAFFNENTRTSQIYYKGRIYDLEKSLVGDSFHNFIAGDNIFVYYNNNTKYLKSFFSGDIWYVLQTPSEIDYKPGQNTIAYIDLGRNTFHAFYKGKIVDLEDYEPKSYSTGDDLIAYIDQLGNFKAFYSNEIFDISTFEPDFYEVRDSLVVFAEQGAFKVFYKGKIHEFGNFIPEKYQCHESTIAFIGPNGWLHAFTNGEFIKVTNDLVSSYAVFYNAICINTTGNKIKVYSNGKLHDTN